MNRRARRAARSQGQRKERQATTVEQATRPGGILRRLTDEVLVPNAEKIAEIVCAGGIAVAVFEPSEQWKQALAVHGWAGEPVFAMPDALRATKMDHVADAWLARAFQDGDPARVFAVVHGGSLLLNHTPGVGWGVEPGSGDPQVLN